MKKQLTPEELQRAMQVFSWVWNAIAPDMNGTYHMKNGAVIETCFDYVGMYGGHTKKDAAESEAFVKDLVARYGYDRVRIQLTKNLHLV